jgi:glycosyltransferase involved in cell wall biosynthesis
MPHANGLVKERPRLLIVGDAIAPTGFARVLHSIFDQLKSDYEVHHLGVHYNGDPHDSGWKIYPAQAGGDLVGLRRIKPLVTAIQPDLVFLLGDVFILGDYLEELRGFQPGLRIVMYSPVDTGPIDHRFLERLDGVDRFVAYTRFGKAELDRAADEARLRRPGLVFPEVEVIPHGVDTRLFHPLDAAHPRIGREWAIHTILGNDARAAGAFIVLNANRNVPRKRMDVTIKGFSLFAANKPANVLLYLHTGLEDLGWDVLRLAERCGVADRLLLSDRCREHPNIPAGKLNVTYNAAAVGLNTSLGEGWGLVSFEHAATRAAQVVPRHTSCAELWAGSAQFVEPVASLTLEGFLSEGLLVSPEGVAEALERLYENPALLDDLAEAAYRTARRPEYQWPAIARRWHQLFQETLQPRNVEDRLALNAEG